MNIEEFNIENSDSKNLLGVKSDNKWGFNCHVSDICKKSSRKINALARVSPYMIYTKDAYL